VGDGEVVLAERFGILPGSPIPELSTPGAKAYVAQNLKNPNELVFARIAGLNQRFISSQALHDSETYEIREFLARERAQDRISWKLFVYLVGRSIFSPPRACIFHASTKLKSPEHARNEYLFLAQPEARKIDPRRRFFSVGQHPVTFDPAADSR
jgi:hypothetical protein